MQFDAVSGFRGGFDRRAFLISYDTAIDPEGLILERHLLINGPVGVLGPVYVPSAIMIRCTPL